jgi:uncharacterized damage-inducible protein DinB
MTEVELIASQIDRAYRDGFWGGGSIGGLFHSLAASEAFAHPIPEAHSAWEIALHIGVWHDIFRGRIEGADIEDALESDWPVPAGATAADWEATLAALDRGLERLVDAVRRLDPKELDAVVRGKNFTVYEMLHGIPQHDLYHAGQALMLRKAIRGR